MDDDAALLQAWRDGDGDAGDALLGRHFKGVVRFFPDGAATGGRVRLLANGAGWDVDVRWLTGEVVVRRVRGER